MDKTEGRTNRSRHEDTSQTAKARTMAEHNILCAAEQTWRIPVKSILSSSLRRQRDSCSNHAFRSLECRRDAAREKRLHQIAGCDSAAATGSFAPFRFAELHQQSSHGRPPHPRV